MVEFELRIVAYPLASKVHPREYYERILGEYEAYLKLLRVEFKETTTTLSEVNEIDERVDLAIILTLTGGTGKIAYELGVKLKGPLVLMAHGYHNSLPSALSARSRLKLEGRKVKLIFSERPANVCKEAFALTRGVKLAESLKNLKVGLIDASNLSEEAKLFVDKFKAEVKCVPTSEVREAFNSLTEMEVEDCLKKLAGKINFNHVDAEDVKRCLSIFLAFKKIVEEEGFNSVTVDCFPFIQRFNVTPCLALSLLNDEGIIGVCEADFKALALMTIAKELTSMPGWIGNPCSYQNGKLVLAHCTIASKLAKHVKLEPHFETGKPCALNGEIKSNIYTLTALSHDFETIAAKRVKVVEGGRSVEGRCRTQVTLDLEGEEIVDKLIGNHHVLILGDVVKELEYFSWYFDLNYVKY